VGGAWDRTARQWDVETGKTILAPIETEHENMYAVVYSPDTAMIATAGPVVGESSVRIWDAKIGHELRTPLKLYTSSVLLAVYHGREDTNIRIIRRLDQDLEYYDMAANRSFGETQRGYLHPCLIFE
jgi:WD40 repeat protein